MLVWKDMDESAAANNFLGLEEQFSDLNGSRFVVLPIPYEGTVSYLKGTASAPAAIIAASQQVELFDEVLLDEFYQCGIATAKAVEVSELSPEELQKKIYAAAKAIVEKDKFVLGLGGEHSITPALIKAACEKYPNISVLHIDAHADLRDEYLGSKFNHACVMRRIWDMQIPAVSAGVRSFDRNQFEFIEENKPKILSPAYIDQKSDWQEQVLAELTDDVYITVDIDGLDPAFAPGVGTPEPGGLSYTQVANLILEVGIKKKIVGADIVEVIPSIAGVVTEFTAAKLGYKIIAAAQLKNVTVHGL